MVPSPSAIRGAYAVLLLAAVRKIEILIVAYDSAALSEHLYSSRRRIVCEIHIVASIAALICVGEQAGRLRISR